MPSLDLEIEDCDDGSLVITWNDAQKRDHIPTLAFILTLPVVFIVMMSIEGGTSPEEFLGSVLVTIFLGWIPALVVYFIAKIIADIPIRRRLIITPEEVISGTQSIPLAHVTRVEYGARSQWDTSNAHASKNTQIRIWERDLRYIVAAENYWTQAVNHGLHGTIQEQIRMMQKQVRDDRPPDRGRPSGSPNGFDLPDY